MLNDKDALFASKMHTILQLSDALDYSRKQKAVITDISLETDRLVITVNTNEDFTLEQWRFMRRAFLFREVFGITPKLKINNILY